MLELTSLIDNQYGCMEVYFTICFIPFLQLTILIIVFSGAIDHVTHSIKITREPYFTHGLTKMNAQILFGMLYWVEDRGLFR